MGKQRRSSHEQITPEQLKRVCRIYGNNRDAARALGIAPQSLNRLCSLHRVPTPFQRRKAAAGTCLTQ